MDILRLNIEKDPPPPTETEVRLHVALLAGVAAVAASLAARFVFGAPLIPELLAQFIFAVSPIWVVEIAVGFLGPFAKHLAFLACVVVYLIALAFAALGHLRFASAQESALVRRAGLAAFALITWASTLLVIIPALGGGLAGRYLRQGALYTSVSLFFVHLVYGVALAVASKLYIEKSPGGDRRKAIVGRRRVIRGVGYAVLAVGAYDIARSLLQPWWQSGSGRVKGGDGVFPNIDDLALEVTPTADFYEVSKNAFDPDVDAKRWKLEVSGLVENPLSLTYDEIRSLPSIQQYATLACISNEVGGDLIGNALWRGVRLKDLLERAMLKEGVVDIVLKAGDDYTDSIPLDRALNEATALVYEMNGEPLTPAHGFPLRLLVPGIYGMKNVKWITRVEAVSYDLKGYWQRRGWNDRAEYKTMSRIDAPGNSVKGGATIAGVAFAGDRGISRVEVSTDGGRTWQDAEIKAPLSPIAWALWQKPWTPAQPGKHRVLVRATDGRGITQTAQHAPPDPDGSSGYDSKVISSEGD
ncbi:MAG TPA: molybdopterin-dependent oxidoreductase [Blastocatellia bacterium]|nr:molybdopterin-dependent oxidoreductase [Blastocatellia bacterium]